MIKLRRIHKANQPHPPPEAQECILQQSSNAVYESESASETCAATYYHARDDPISHPETTYPRIPMLMPSSEMSLDYLVSGEAG